MGQQAPNWFRTVLLALGLAAAIPASSARLLDELGSTSRHRVEASIGRYDGVVSRHADPEPLEPALPNKADFEDGDDATVRRHWALLIAGSSGWGNYRHQADVSHAYHVLRRGGLQPQHIVVMMYDDIAHNFENPYPGKVFNRPGGPDVYNGVRIDYRGEDVNAANFLAVLEGNASTVAGVGSGRVLASGPTDRVFVFYSDHGAPGVLGMPTGSFLYADDLVAALTRKHRRRGYKEAVLYIEACESGSMFEGLLANDIGVYATTASNAFESSWGTYCPGMDPQPTPAPAPGPSLDTCLGDLYSVAWMEDADSDDLTRETLLDQYDLVRNRTSNNYTYTMGSHVMQYGALSIDREVAGDYEGMKNNGGQAPAAGSGPAGGAVSRLAAALSRFLGLPFRISAAGAAGGDAMLASSTTSAGGSQRRARRRVAQQQQQALVTTSDNHHNRHHVEQRSADLVHLRHRAHHGSKHQSKEAAQAALDAELSRRQLLDSVVQRAAQRLLLHPAAVRPLSERLGVASQQLYAAVLGGASNALVPQALYVDALAHGPMGRPSPGVPLVDDWGCLRAMVEEWEERCGRMDDYAMRHTRFLANLCNAGLSSALLGQVLPPAGECNAGGAAAAAVAVS